MLASRLAGRLRVSPHEIITVPNLRVSRSVNITGYGVAVFFEHPPVGLAWGSSVAAVITRPGVNATIQAIAVVEAARVATPPGEIAVFRFPNLSQAEVPAGSLIVFEEPI